MSKPHAHIRLDFSATCSVGPGKVSLLEGIARTGSLSAAARAMGMSYRRGWLLLRSINEDFNQPVVELSVGGRQGGGAKLTEFGLQLVNSYREFETAVDALAGRNFASIRLSGTPSEETAGARRPVSRTIKGSAKTASR